MKCPVNRKGKHWYFWREADLNGSYCPKYMRCAFCGYCPPRKYKVPTTTDEGGYENVD